MGDYLDTLFRALVLFAVILVLTKMLGKRHLSELTFFDYVTGITIGAIAGSTSVNEHVKLMNGIISLLIWTLIPFIFASINLKSLTFKRLIGTKPLIVIENGNVQYENMSKARYNIEDLLLQLRQKDVFDLSEVELAILEANGQLSVLKKAPFNNVTAKDLNISSPYKGVIANLIINGNVIEANLKLVKKDINWLLEELAKRMVKSVHDVVFAGLTTDGKLEIVTKN